MTHFVYILYTSTHDKYYVGETEDLEQRIAQHNTGKFQKASTKYTTDWKVVLKFAIEQKQDKLNDI